MIKWTDYHNKPRSDIHFKLHIDLENDAFADDPRAEIARILKHLANNIEDIDLYTLCYCQNIKDINGNFVGTYAIKPIKD